MGEETVRPVPYLRQPKFERMPKKYTATVQRIRKVTVEAETQERASRLLQRRLEPGEKILSVQTSLL